MISYLVHYETILKNATYIITKCDKSLLQNARVITNATSASLQPATSLKERLQYNCFSVNFSNFLRTTFFQEHVWATASEI